MLPGVLAVVVVVLLWPCVSHGSGSAPDNQRGQLTVLTYNTHRMGGFCKVPQNRVVQYLLRQDADVVCLQEVEVRKNAKYLTLAELRAAMQAKYPYSYVDFAVYNQRRQFGNVVFSKYPLIHKETIRYTSRANISSRCDIVVKGDTIRLITNHLESNKLDKKDFAEDLTSGEAIRETAQRLSEKMETARELRHEQARIVRAAIDASPYPIIVVGDFNDTPLSYTYWKMRGWMRDCFLSTSWGRMGFTYIYHHVGVRIDYILCSRDLHPTECHVDRVRHSDHYPVVSTIAW